jgi:hypothetical protein
MCPAKVAVFLEIRISKQGSLLMGVVEVLGRRLLTPSHGLICSLASPGQVVCFLLCF